MPLATLWWRKVGTSLQHCLQQLLQLFIWDWRGAQMVLPEQVETKTACTFPAEDIPPGKATPAEITVLLTAICHCHFSLAQVTVSEQCLHPDVSPNTPSLHSPSTPTTVRKHMTVQSLMLALMDGVQSDKAIGAAVQACLGHYVLAALTCCLPQLHCPGSLLRRVGS